MWNAAKMISNNDGYDNRTLYMISIIQTHVKNLNNLVDYFNSHLLYEDSIRHIIILLPISPFPTTNFLKKNHSNTLNDCNINLKNALHISNKSNTK